MASRKPREPPWARFSQGLGALVLIFYWLSPPFVFKKQTVFVVFDGRIKLLNALSLIGPSSVNGLFCADNSGAGSCFRFKLQMDLDPGKDNSRQGRFQGSCPGLAPPNLGREGAWFLVLPDSKVFLLPLPSRWSEQNLGGGQF